MRFIETLEPPKPIRLKTVLDLKPQLEKFFRSLPVEMVFLHGSLAKDNLKPLSDIDVAVLFKEKRYDYKHFTKITEKLAELFGREDIDLAVLNKASSILGMQVLKNGRLLFCRSQKTLKLFRLRTIQRYLSTKFLRVRFSQYAKAAILGGRP